MAAAAAAMADGPFPKLATLLQREEGDSGFIKGAGRRQGHITLLRDELALTHEARLLGGRGGSGKGGSICRWQREFKESRKLWDLSNDIEDRVDWFVRLTETQAGGRMAS